MTSIVYREYLKYIRIMRRLTLITRSCHEVWSIRWTARDLLPNNLRLNLNVLFSSSLEFLPHTCTTIYSGTVNHPQERLHNRYLSNIYFYLEVISI